MTQFIKRISLFIVTNLAVMFVFSIILNILGVNSNSFKGLFIFALVFGFGGSFISLLLSKKMALSSVGGKIIENPQNNQEKWLFDIVQQQSQKAQIKMPDISIYQSSDINAFATGAFKNSSLVAVSSELLRRMNKDEAEAVIAHEISHISNGDMVTMTLLQGVLNTFVIFISRILATIISQALSNNKNQNSLNTVYYIIAPIFEMIFGVLASVIAMWFSRYREFHADAGSARLVGKEKMIAALKKLKSSHEPREDSYIKAFCINGSGSFKFSELFLSHPPLEKRIEALRNDEYLQPKPF